MRNQENVFHLAIPCSNLDDVFEFYVMQLGCKLARRYEDRITLDFFGDQLVCHLNPEKTDKTPEMYPRHFGVTFKEKKEFDCLHNLALNREIDFFEQLFVRFKGFPEEHWSFFLKDPSNNLLEFKYYLDPHMMY